MQSFEVEILNPHAANILHDLEELKLIKLKKKPKASKKQDVASDDVMTQIEKGLKDVALIQSGKIKPKTLSQILHGK